MAQEEEHITEEVEVNGGKIFLLVPFNMSIPFMNSFSMMSIPLSSF